MTDSRNPDQIIRAFLSEGLEELSDGVYDSVRDQLHHNRQRVVIGPWRLPIMNSNALRLALVAAVLVVAVIIGANLLPRRSVGPAPPSVQPSAAPSGLGFLYNVPTGDAPAGTYELNLAMAVPAHLTLTVPAGFNTDQGGIEAIHSTSGPQSGIEFQFASNVYPDPCHRSSGAADPAIGASVDDLVTAMTSLVGFQPGPVADLTIAGFAAKGFDLTNDIDSSTCDQ